MEHKPKPGWKPWKPPPEKENRLEQQPKSRWRPTNDQVVRATKVLAALLITVLVISMLWLLWRDVIKLGGNSDYVLRAVLTVVGILILIGIGYRFEWTGFVVREREKSESGEIQRRKTLWNWMSLLLVPLMIAGIASWFTWWQNNSQRALEAQQRAQEAENLTQSALLQAYLDQMSQLVFERDLRNAREDSVVFTLARARTTTTITQLDGQQNQIVTRFLHDSGLLSEPALLTYVGLENAELPKAVLQGANLTGTNLRGANLAEAELQDANLADTQQLNRANLAEAKLRDANLAGTDLRGGNLAGAVLIEANFSAEEKVDGGTQSITADLTKADLTKAALQEADLAHCTLDEANLTNATLQRADLSNASLRDANLSYAALENADLISASLQHANLSHAALQNADLISAESTADLQDAPLWFLKKEATNLTDANLSHAALQDADLSNAYLSGAELTDANLTDADLSEAKGWTMEQLTAARSLKGATMPNGQKYEDWLKDR